MTEHGSDAPPADEDDLGPFRSWGQLYLAVIVYTIVTIAILYGLTIAFDFSLT